MLVIAGGKAMPKKVRRIDETEANDRPISFQPGIIANVVSGLNVSLHRIKRRTFRSLGCLLSKTSGVRSRTTTRMRLIYVAVDMIMQEQRDIVTDCAGPRA